MDAAGMNILIYAMIYAGSALMAYNIVRCYGFVKRMRAIGGLENLRWILPVPLVLLVLFLVGYLFVAFFGEPDLAIGGILLGGSIFVFIVLGVMYQVIDYLHDSNERSNALLVEVKNDLQDLTKDYLMVLHVNLTKDVIEEMSGSSIREEDRAYERYSEFIMHRKQRFVAERGLMSAEGLFMREGLLECFEFGHMTAEETLFANLGLGRSHFLKVQATLAAQPDTGDIIAFIVEGICDDEMVNDVLLNRALAGQFDMITSLVDGRYSVVIGDPSLIERGSIFPRNLEGDYDTYLSEQVAPYICGSEDDRAALVGALSLEGIERGLEQGEPYEVNIPVFVDDEVFYKKFSFYVVNRRARFYLLMKSDTTEARREEIERNDQLRAALEEARRASRSKSTFLSSVSHDIRTPMNAIVGYTEFAKRSTSLDEALGYLDKIDDSSKYMLALVNDVLEMSRIESGKMQIISEPCDLLEVIAGVRALFEAQMAEKSIAYTVDVSQVKNGRVLCDKTRLNRVLLNLLSNAYKFTPEGGSVSVSLAQLDAPEKAAIGVGVYELRVEDTGIGMSEEFARNVFEAFERERTATASGIQGTGLGMAIAKNIVELLGGTIDVRTEQGRGTEFTVHLELELQADSAEGSQADEDVLYMPGLIDFTGMRVLLVEDNEINREIATMMLTHLGFVVEDAADGQKALDTLAACGAGHFDIVVTDIQMPVMGGYDEARAIRALDDPELASIPIVAMSANAFAEDIQASREAGMDAHIAKPIDMGVLAETLARVLTGADRAGASRTAR